MSLRSFLIVTFVLGPAPAFAAAASCASVDHVLESFENGLWEPEKKPPFEGPVRSKFDFHDKYDPDFSFTREKQPIAGKHIEEYRKYVGESNLRNAPFGGDIQRFDKGVHELAQHPELSELSWVHGSNSGSLPGVAEEGNKLVPTGKLLENGKVPFSGEVDVGASARGVNQSYLSGNRVHSMGQAVQYAEGHFTTPFKWDTEARNLGKLFEPSEVAKLHGHDLEQFLSRARLSARRLNVWDHEKLEYEFQGMAKKLDELERLHPEERVRIDAIKNELHSAPIEKLTVEDKKMIEESFPIVYGSTSNEQKAFGGAGMSTEWIKSEAVLGKDVKFMFTDAKHVETLKHWVASRGLAGKVEVLDMDTLRAMDNILGNSPVVSYQTTYTPENIRKVIGQVQEYDHDLQRVGR